MPSVASSNPTLPFVGSARQRCPCSVAWDAAPEPSRSFKLRRTPAFIIMIGRGDANQPGMPPLAIGRAACHGRGQRARAGMRTQRPAGWTIAQRRRRRRRRRRRGGGMKLGLGCSLAPAYSGSSDRNLAGVAAAGSDSEKGRFLLQHLRGTMQATSGPQARSGRGAGACSRLLLHFVSRMPVLGKERIRSVGGGRLSYKELLVTP